MSFDDGFSFTFLFIKLFGTSFICQNRLEVRDFNWVYNWRAGVLALDAAICTRSHTGPEEMSLSTLCADLCDLGTGTAEKHRTDPNQHRQIPASSLSVWPWRHPFIFPHLTSLVLGIQTITASSNQISRATQSHLTSPHLCGSDTPMCSRRASCSY